MTDTPMGEMVLGVIAEFPNAESRALAQILLHRYPQVFTDIEQARTRVRYYRGAMGDEHRKKRPLDTTKRASRFLVPASDTEPRTMYEFHEQDFPMIMGSDAHFPYHSEDAVEVFLEQADKIKAKTIVLLGDWMDFYKGSDFEQDPRQRDMLEEIEMFKTFLHMVRKAYPKQKIVYKIGNHEERWDRYIMRKAPQLFGLPSLQLNALLELDKLKIDYVTDKRTMRYKNFFMIHGHEYKQGISAPVNPARGLYLRAKKSTVCGHHHQTSEHPEPEIDGSIIACYSLGCLCDLAPDYMPNNRWNHGFGEMYAIDGGMWQFVNRKIIRGRVL